MGKVQCPRCLKWFVCIGKHKACTPVPPREPTDGERWRPRCSEPRSHVPHSIPFDSERYGYGDALSLGFAMMGDEDR